LHERFFLSFLSFPLNCGVAVAHIFATSIPFPFAKQLLYERFFLSFLSYPLNFGVAVAATGAPPITKPANMVMFIFCCICIDSGACYWWEAW
jgi:hypothetical protein